MNEQISLMGLSVLRRLLCDIRRVQWFSLILEATDVSHKEEMVCIR